MDAPGLLRRNRVDSLGVRGLGCMDLVLEDVVVDSSHLIGQPGQGFAIAMEALDGGRVAIAAQALGVGEAALQEALGYAKRRVAFGQPIAQYQAIQFMLADMAIDIYTMKYMVLQTAALIENATKIGKLPVKEISISKAYCVEKTQECYDRAIQVHGGMGLTNELPLNEGFRIARTLRIPDGTGEIQRRTIARQMLRGDVVF
jgi:alkylation response protein AidB-like acyl-CoA dehydrogenase